MDRSGAVLLPYELDRDHLPVHPKTGERAIGVRKDGRPVWPTHGSDDQYWLAPLTPIHTVAGAAFNTFTTFQDISPAVKPVAYGESLHIGSKIEIEAWGEFSNTATPTLSLGFFWGTAAIVLAASAAVTTTTGATGWPWHLKYDGTVLGTGTVGSILGQGLLDLGTSLVAMTSQFIPTTLALRTVAIDTTVNKYVGLGAAWSASSASNTIKCNDLRVYKMN